MLEPSKICWSWRHERPVRSEPGHWVCAEHLDEEPKILEMFKQLGELHDAINIYLDDIQPQRQHPSQAQVLEGAIANFFLRSFPSLKSGRAFRINLTGKTQSELDIVIDIDSANWFASSRRHIVGSPPLAHIELSYRSQFDLQKIKDDLQRVHETVVAAAALQPPKKVWTAVVCLGPGWEGHRSSIVKGVHEYFHDQAPRQIQIESLGLFWDFPDIVALPGLVLVKQEFCAEPGVFKNYPVYSEMPSAMNDPMFKLRSLAVARGFFESFVGAFQHGKLKLAQAWPDADASAILGPNMRIEESEPMAVCLIHAPQNLFAWDPRPEGLTLFLHYRTTRETCSLSKHYRYKRYKDSPLDGKRLL